MMMNNAVEDVVIFKQKHEIEKDEQLDNKNELDMYNPQIK